MQQILLHLYMVNQQFAIALHIMTSLAYKQGEKAHSDELAKSLRSHPVVVRRLLTCLSRAGLIQTSRGKMGGSEIVRKLQQISLAEIYAAVTKKSLLNKTDKPIFKECPVSCSMVKIIDTVVTGVDSAIDSHLKKIKLSDIIKKVE